MTKQFAANTPVGSESQAVSAVVLHQLILEAVLSRTRQDLVFQILNRSINLIHYERASLWRCSENRFIPEGVSGISGLNSHSEIVGCWQKIVSAMTDPESPAVLGEREFSDCAQAAWGKLSYQVGGLAVLWLPIFVQDRFFGGLWLERWEGNQWSPEEATAALPLVTAYGAAFEKFNGHGHLLLWGGGKLKKSVILAGTALVLAILAFFSVPLRLVAPCEIAPRDPFVVSAPLEGVVAEVDVSPGQMVSKGDVLFHYDKRVVEDELKVAAQQVRIIEATLNRLKMQAFSDNEARSQVGLLRLRLEQEQVRLQMAEYRASRLEVTSEIRGRVVIDDPHQWRGRPVAVGERVMMIVVPGRTKLHIRLPVDDKITFERQKPVKVFLNAFPESVLNARLTYVSEHVSNNPSEFPAFMAEALFIDQDERLRLGLKGTAVLYGENVSVGYWLLRKPLAAFRRFVGF